MHYGKLWNIPKSTGYYCSRISISNNTVWSINFGRVDANCSYQLKCLIRASSNIIITLSSTPIYCSHYYESIFSFGFTIIMYCCKTFYHQLLSWWSKNGTNPILYWSFQDVRLIISDKEQLDEGTSYQVVWEEKAVLYDSTGSDTRSKVTHFKPTKVHMT